MRSSFSFLHLLPDADPAGSGSAQQGAVRTPRLPVKDDDIVFVTKTVAQKWASHPQITLLWITQAQFGAAANAFAASMGKRHSTGSNRPAQAQEIRNLDKQTDDAISSLKIDLQKKFGKENAYAQYSRYGVNKRGKNYELPRDRDQRLAAIRLIPTAMSEDGIDGAPYNKDWWTEKTAQYNEALQKANNTAGTVSALVGEKNQHKETLLKAMRALQLVIQGNYPDTYESIYREWGWQKEDY